MPAASPGGLRSARRGRPRARRPRRTGPLQRARARARSCRRAAHRAPVKPGSSLLLDRRPGVAQLTEHRADPVDLGRIAIEPRLEQIALAEHVDRLQAGRDLASLLHVQHLAEVQEDVLGAAQLAVSELDLTLAHRDCGLVQEAASTVVEHHDQLLGLCAQHRAFAVGTRGGEVAHLDGSPKRRLNGLRDPAGCSVTRAGSTCCCSWPGNRPAPTDLKPRAGDFARVYLLLMVGSELIWLASQEAVDWFCDSVASSAANWACSAVCLAFSVSCIAWMRLLMSEICWLSPWMRLSIVPPTRASESTMPEK